MKKSGNTINWKWENKELPRIQSTEEVTAANLCIYFQKVSYTASVFRQKFSPMCMGNYLGLEIMTEIVLQVSKQYLLSE